MIIVLQIEKINFHKERESDHSSMKTSPKGPHDRNIRIVKGAQTDG